VNKQKKHKKFKTKLTLGVFSCAAAIEQPLVGSLFQSISCLSVEQVVH
jgi:hypothetical protein